jgi:hypothetical protein
MEPKNIGPGRPKGTGRDTKAKIGKIASKQFSEIGYEKTTIRSVGSIRSSSCTILETKKSSLLPRCHFHMRLRPR